MDDMGESQKHWTYVGQGNGNYEKVEKYMQVSGGAYSITEVPTRRISPMCCCWCLCALGMTLVLLLVFLLRGPLSSAIGSVGSDMMAASDDFRYSSPMYDCSVGTWLTNFRSDVEAGTRAYRGQAFKDSDTNFDGLLSPGELSAASSKLPQCFAQYGLQWDQDGNGLSLGEMEAGLAQQAGVKSHDILLEPAKTMAVADLDCDGFISVPEFRAMYSHPLPQHTKDLLIGGDVDADGKLGRVEMIAALQKSMVASNPAQSNRLTAEIWNETKRAWCCHYEQLGCQTTMGDTPESPSCEEGNVLAWSTEKKERCCATVGMGCPHRPSTYDCAISHGDHPEDWPKEKRDKCCEHYGLGCDAEPYNCVLGLTDWQAGWTAAQKQWCCDHKQLGCSDTQYDCKSDEKDWSAHHRKYCCTAHQAGCEDATIPKPKFNCREGWPDDVDSWEKDKEEFCCSNYARCKDESPSPAYQHPHPAAFVMHFDCHDGLTNWKTLWHPAKTAWCCAHRDLGCDHHGHFDCDAGSKKSWPSEKQDYCCLYHNKGCHFDAHSTQYVYSDADAPEVPGHDHYVTTDGDIEYPHSYHYSYDDSYSGLSPADGRYPEGLKYAERRYPEGLKYVADDIAGSTELPHVKDVSEQHHHGQKDHHQNGDHHDSNDHPHHDGKTGVSSALHREVGHTGHTKHLPEGSKVVHHIHTVMFGGGKGK